MRMTIIAASLALAVSPVALADVDRAPVDELVPIEQIVESARQVQPGFVYGVELESERRAYVYEVKVLGDDGEKHELTFDAITGGFLERERD
jgi:uncharacterized membrane protein YkoI